MSAPKSEIKEFAAKLFAFAQQSKLTWDQAVAGMGLAAKGLAVAEAEASSSDDSIVLAQSRLDEGFKQPVSVIFAGSDPSQLKALYPEEAKTIVENANIKLFMKLS